MADKETVRWGAAGPSSYVRGLKEFLGPSFLARPGFGAYREVWKEMGGPEALEKTQEAAERLVEDPRGGLRETFRGAFRAAERSESKAGAMVLGLGAGLAEEMGGWADLVGTGPLTPLNLPAKVADAVMNSRPSDLIRPRLPGQGAAARATEDMLEELDRAFSQYGTAEFGEFLGRWLPAFAGGAYAAGASRQLLMAYGPALLKSMGERGLSSSFTAWAARGMVRAGDKMLVDQALRQGGTVVSAIPWFERMMMAVGNASGFGAFEAGREVVHGGELGEAFKVGAVTAGVGAVGEISLVGLGRAVMPSLRKVVDTRVLKERWERVAGKLRTAVLAGDVSKLKTLTRRARVVEDKQALDFLARGEKQYAKLVDEEVVGLTQDFAESTANLTEAQRVDRLRRMAQAVRKADEGKWEGYLAKQMGLTEDSVIEAAPGAREEFFKYVRAVHERERKLFGAFNDIKQMGLMTSGAPIVRRALDDTPVSPQQLLREAESDTLSIIEAMKEGGGSRLALMVNGLRRSWLGVHEHIIDKVLKKHMSSPSTLARQMGVSGLRFADLVENTGRFIRIFRAKVHMELDGLEGAFKEAGVDPRLARDAWEQTKSMEAVRQAVGTRLGEMWEKAAYEPVEFVANALHKIGVHSKMSEAERELLGAPGYFPQVMKGNVPIGRIETQLYRMLRRQGKTDSEAWDVINSGSWRATGARRFGTIDFQRKLPGTTAEKVKKRVPLEDDPIQALRDHLDASIVRLGMSSVFGPNWELGQVYKMGMIAEGGSEHVANYIVDAVLFQRTADNFTARLCRNITSLQTITKMSWSALPNSFQSIMTGIRFGGKSTLQAIKETGGDVASNMRFVRNREWLVKRLASEDKGTIAMAQNFLEKSLLSSATVFEGKQAKTLMEKVAEWSLKGYMFTPSERMDRMIAGHAALADTRSLVTRMARGELRGEAYVHARRGLDSLGVDIDQVLGRYQRSGKLGLTAKQVDSVIVNGVKQTQFMTGAMDIPATWRTPQGKLIAQFKSFAFNAGKLTRDQVWREFDQGNYKPLMYFLGLGGVGGEAIGLVVDFAKGRERDVPNGPMRVIEALSNFGGFGLLSSVVQGAFYKHPAETVLGPSYGDALGVLQDVVRGAGMGSAGEATRTIRRQPVIQLGGRLAEVAGYVVDGTADAIKEGWDWEIGEGKEGAIDLDEWRRLMREGAQDEGARRK